MHVSRRQLTLGLMLVCVCATLDRVSDGADRAPATQRVAPLERVKQLVAQLADRDYDRRDAARVALMGFGRADLLTIREAVRLNLPLAPSQVSVIRDIVTHVYLTGSTYLPDEKASGFLGVTLPNKPEELILLEIERGVAITGALPGFCSYRMLRDGDVLLSLTLGRERIELLNKTQLREAVMAVRAGETVTFEVLRQGRTLTVPVTLDSRPFGIDSITPEEFAGRRIDEADEYWRAQFAPLLGEALT
jgi:S1-C subfamily serine protease